MTCQNYQRYSNYQLELSRKSPDQTLDELAKRRISKCIRKVNQLHLQLLHDNKVTSHNNFFDFIACYDRMGGHNSLGGRGGTPLSSWIPRAAQENLLLLSCITKMGQNFINFFS